MKIQKLPSSALMVPMMEAKLGQEAELTPLSASILAVTCDEPRVIRLMRMKS